MRLGFFPYLGWLLLALAVMAMVPAALALGQGLPAQALAFVATGFAMAFIGAGVIIALARSKGENSVAEAAGFLLVGWLTVPAFAATPLFLYTDSISWIDAYYAAVASFTTTGAIGLPPSAWTQPHLLWSALLQWSGGFVTILAAAVVLNPLIYRGFSLRVVPSPGLGDEPILARLPGVARILLPVYAAITVGGFIALWSSGSEPFDAFVLALVGIATGSLPILAPEQTVGGVAAPTALGHAVFAALVFAGALNAMVHWYGIQGRFRQYRDDSETANYTALMLFSIALMLAAWLFMGRDDFGGALFTAVSLTTTSGFGVTAIWGEGPPPPAALVLGMAITGGAAISTSGGLKMLRVVMMFKLARRELEKLAYPRAVDRTRHSGRVVGEDLFAMVAVYFVAYMMLLAVTAAIAGMHGLSLDAAVPTAVAALANVGPVGELVAGAAGAPESFPPSLKLVLSLIMVIGRVEVLALLGLFMLADRR